VDGVYSADPRKVGGCCGDAQVGGARVLGIETQRKQPGAALVLTPAATRAAATTLHTRAHTQQVPEAVCLPSLTYNEAWELSYFGANVLHPRTTLPAMRYKIPIAIRNFFNLDAPGGCEGRGVRVRRVRRTRVCAETEGGVDARGGAFASSSISTQHQ
jgi:hypothetical protein